jgi:hypothetical protein
MTKVIALLALSAALCSGGTVISALPDYNGAPQSTGFPINVGSIGTFTYSLPVGVTIDSATLSGTWGSAGFATSTAGMDLLLEGVNVGGCQPFASNCWANGAPLRPFSFSVPSSVFLNLLDGNADLSLIQTNQTSIRLGTPTLTVDFTSAPEPNTTLLFLFGLLGGLCFRRLRRV